MKQWSRFFTAAALAATLSMPAGSWANDWRSWGDHEREHDKGAYMAGDFHQHTTYTDGSKTFPFVMEKNDQFGLDWWANSEHGGVRARDGQDHFWDDPNYYDPNPILDDIGQTDLKHQAMWRWQSLMDYAYYDIVAARAKYPTKRIVSGVEWNVPGHEHCSVGVIPLPDDNTADAVAAFEYQFDKSDGDTQLNGGKFGDFGPLVKENQSNSHQAAVRAVTWMQTQYNKGKIDDAWIIFAHVERAGAWVAKPAGQNDTGSGGYNVESFRDFNNAAPDICFGFEGVPGHQAGTNRGEFGSGASGGGTYGGAGIYTARTGGLWDALLGEGRRWFNFASSDFHTHWDAGGSDYYPGEYQKTWTYVVGKDRQEGVSLKEIAQGLRSGNSFLTSGDIIDALIFKARSAVDEVTMGGELTARRGKDVEIEIRFKSPEFNNHCTDDECDSPVVDHVDLIAGDITGKIRPTDPNYANAANPSAKVIKTFTSADWIQDKDGYNVITYQINLNPVSNSTDSKKWKGVYFRLRGTNNDLNSLEIDQTNLNHDPAKDPSEGSTADQNANAWADLWFYSNPIFVYVK
jgi:hypothetical protein